MLFWGIVAVVIIVLITVSFLTTFAIEKKPIALMLIGIELSIVGIAFMLIAFMLIKGLNVVDFIFGIIGFLFIIIGFTTCIFGFRKYN